MKCAQCYAENPPWSTVCSACGQPVLRLEICPQGHLLPPGVQECSVCPSLWPEVSSFAGPPILRGILWVESGRLSTTSEPEKDVAFLEIRDQETPLAFSLNQSGAANLAGDDDGDVVCRILMRPSGVLVCNKVQPLAHPGPLAYEPLPAGKRIDLGRTTFQFQDMRPPAWVEQLGGVS